MSRAARLQSAVTFVRGFRGKDIVRGYTRWFGVDLGCALPELQMLGVPLDPARIESIRATIRDKERIGRLRNERRKARANVDACDGFEFEFEASTEVGPESDVPF